MNDGEKNVLSKLPSKTRVDWDTISGFRFVLSCYVMFMHIGSTSSWGSFNNLRGFPWHVHVFFILGGYSMALPMNPAIENKLKYFKARIGSMYPMYLVSLLFGLVNLLVVCRPSTFKKEFNWDSQPNDLFTEDGELAPLFCEGTVATPTSYWASLFLTVFIYLFGLAVTPLWPLSWVLGYYLWFNSMYYQCLAIFPSMYNKLYMKARKNTRLLLKIIIFFMALNYLVLLVPWFILKNSGGYNHYDIETGEKNSVENYTDGSLQNAWILSFYLFGPFWMIYFVIGGCLAFLYDAYNPTGRDNAHIWGLVADGCTVLMISISITFVTQGTAANDEVGETFFFRAEEANSYLDNQSINRLWDNISARFSCPLTTLWIFALSTGEGTTARFLRGRFLVETLAPNSYNCFLFHQMVCQWYFAATRNGQWWNWWNYRKTFYWFSPSPVPVEWYEYFYIVGLTVCFSSMMNILVPQLIDNVGKLKRLVLNENYIDSEFDTTELLIEIVEDMTGIVPKMDWSLEECGLGSVGVPVITARINNSLSTRNLKVTVTATEIVTADTIADLVDVVDNAILLAEADGI